MSWVHIALLLEVLLGSDDFDITCEPKNRLGFGYECSWVCSVDVWLLDNLAACSRMQLVYIVLYLNNRCGTPEFVIRRFSCIVYFSYWQLQGARSQDLE